MLDNETGLVWEKILSLDTSNWIGAVRGCYQKVVGGRFGWRLPAIEELSTLVDPSQGVFGVSAPLPAGHPVRANRSGHRERMTGGQRRVVHRRGIDRVVRLAGEEPTRRCRIG